MTRERYWVHSGPEPPPQASTITGSPARLCTRPGCVVPDVHAPDCSCRDDGHEHTDPVHPHDDDELCDDECRWCDWCVGCQPREADHDSWLCRRDTGRIRRSLIEAPELVAWVASNVEPGQQARDDARVAGSREAPAPLNVAALDAVDRVVTVLVELADQHADHVGVSLPNLDGARTTVRGQVDRVTGAKSAQAAYVLVDRLCAWHLGYLASITRQPDASVWWQVVEATADAWRKFPAAPRAKRIPIPCPECDRLTLYMPPPRGVPHYNPDGSLQSAPAIAVYCGTDECGAVLTEGDYARLVLAAKAAAEGARRG